MADDPIDKKRAKEFVDEAEFGYIYVGHIDPVPAIGKVPEEEREVEVNMKSYRFGDWPEEDGTNG